MPKITIPDGDWVLLREHNEKFKSGERRALFEVRDQVVTRGEATANLLLIQHVIAFLIRDWSYDAPRPRAVMADGYGIATFENMGSLDEVDIELENEMIDEAKWWMTKILPDFSPAQDPESPTSASDG